MSLLDDLLNGLVKPSEWQHSLPKLLRGIYYQERGQHIPMLSPARSRFAGGTSPSLVTFGSLMCLQFTLGVDEAFRTIKLPRHYKEGSTAFHIHWTKTGDVDESGKNVRWKVDYTVFNGGSDDASSLTGSVEVEDTYEDAGTTTRVVHRTANVALPNISPGYYLALRVSAVTPVGTALAGEPCLSSVDFTWTERINEDPQD